jgi:hypothetical protein
MEEIKKLKERNKEERKTLKKSLFSFLGLDLSYSHCCQTLRL